MKKYIKNSEIVIKIVLGIVVLLFFFIYNVSIRNNEEDLDLNIEEDTNEELDFEVDTSTTDDTEYYLEISGAVKYPGVYSFNEQDIRMFDLIEKAGGLLDANSDCINQVEKLQDAQKIVIPYQSEECSNSASTSNSTDSKVNINTSSLEELTSLNGIGESKANAIIAYREENGSFKSIEELINVSGIGESTLLNISDKITV